jgi:hypothetical protein
MTLDFVRDLLKKLDKQDMQYLLFTFRPDLDDVMIDIFSSIKGETLLVCKKTLEAVAEQMKEPKKGKAKKPKKGKGKL